MIFKKRLNRLGDLSKGFNRSKSDLFPQYYVKEPRQTRVLPWFFFLSCRKIAAFECFAALKRIFFQNNECDDGDTVCLPEEHSEVMGEKVPSKPVKSLTEGASSGSAFCVMPRTARLDIFALRQMRYKSPWLLRYAIMAAPFIAYRSQAPL